MPQSITTPKSAIPRSMSARATETRGEVSKLDKASLSQMQIRLARWGVLLDTLESEAQAGRGTWSRRDGESIADLKASYRTTCQRFEDLRAAGLPQWEAFAASLQVAWTDFERAVAASRNFSGALDQVGGNGIAQKQGLK